jgi:hypothetical protein
VCERPTEIASNGGSEAKRFVRARDPAEALIKTVSKVCGGHGAQGRWMTVRDANIDRLVKLGAAIDGAPLCVFVADPEMHYLAVNAHAYRRFVRRLGAGKFGSREFYGVIDDEWQKGAEGGRKDRPPPGTEGFSFR